MFLACLFLSLGMAMAQTKVTGTVVSQEDGQPVIGATVWVEGSSIGSVTDINGKFTINVPSGKKLVVSYVGMKSATVVAKDGMRVVLEGDNALLDELLVIGYGTQKKSAFTGSATQIDAEEIGKVQVTNAVDALKGKAAGVQINTASGQPGSTPSIRIRGVNSINAGTSPLIVLDGSPFDGTLNDINPADVETMTVLKDAASTALYGARGGNGVIQITTKKGKKGEDAVITVDAKWGSNSKATPEYEVIKSPAKYYEMWYAGLRNYAETTLGYSAAKAHQWTNANMIDGGTYGLGYNVYNVPEGQYLIGSNGKLNPNATLGRVISHNGNEYYITPDDWEDEIYNNGTRQEYTVTATGSTDRSTYYASMNYLDNEGIAAASDYQRITTRLKADYQIKSWLKVGMNMTYGHYNYNSLGNDGSAGSAGNAFAFSNIAPIYPMYIRDAAGKIMYDETSRLRSYDYGDGSIIGLNRSYLAQSNPVSDNLLNTANTEGNMLNATGDIEIRLPHGFTFYSINNVYLNEYRYTDTTNPFFGQYASANGMVTKEHGRSWTYNYQQRLNWNHDFGKHSFDVMLGHEYYRAYGYDLWASKSNQFSVDNKELAGAVVMGSGNSSASDYNTESWLSRVMYDYDDKYFGSVSYMRQASSRFHKDNRWGSFWSVGAGWLINKESWFGADWVDELKLKASYGENGNDNISGYLYTNYFDIVNSNDQVSLTPSSLGNKEITWEKTGKFNAGVDFSFWNGRLSGTFEYYKNKTSDMLSWFSLPPSFGYTGFYDNVGDMENSGIEFALRGDVIRTKDFTWTLYANITSNHNEITKLPEERKSWYDEIGGYGYSSGSYFFQEGSSRFSYWTKSYAGVDPATGLSLFYKNVYETDANGAQVYYDVDGKQIPAQDLAAYTGEKHRKIVGRETTTVYNDADYYNAGDVMPDVYGGFGTSFSWKGFDFSADFQYQIGGKVYDGSYAGLMNISAGHAIHVDLLDAWTKENTATDVPRWHFNDSYMTSSSDRFLTDASYLTLSNITLGYTLPKHLYGGNLQKIRLYVVADNIWTWSKRQGLDPRQSITGSNTNSYYKPMRTISGGVTVTF
jgi:TonB-linked SusC/RagA family outer membrane protein